MREIKFRAWDKCQKHWSGMRDVFIHSGIYYFNVDIKDVALMQYTGLKDKNGTEIYEGDILDRLDNILCVVTFEDGKLGWNIRYKKPEENQRQDYFGRCYAGQEGATKLEVIGNIWENKELLGGK